jgi:hypothetical protein
MNAHPNRERCVELNHSDGARTRSNNDVIISILTDQGAHQIMKSVGLFLPYSAVWDLSVFFLSPTQEYPRLNIQRRRLSLLSDQGVFGNNGYTIVVNNRH